MDKEQPQFNNANEEKEQNKQRIIALTTEIVNSKEVFPFSGIDPAAYSRMKASDEEYPGFTTPIDEIIERMKNEGMKIVFGDHPESGNVFVLPLHSDDIKNDSIQPGLLLEDTISNDNLKELVLRTKG
ncbi:MAG: hypothetical protein M3Q63_00415 [bacterium]|nr:hypothetical protein [bacterium]